MTKDFSLAHSRSRDTVQSAAKISFYAAELREKRKMTKYGQQQSIAGSDTTCIPLEKMQMEKAAKQTLEIDGESNCL